MEASLGLPGVTHRGSHRMPSSCQRLTFAGQQTHWLLAARTPPAWKRCPRSWKEGSHPRCCLSPPLWPLFLTLLLKPLFFPMSSRPNESGHASTTPRCVLLCLFASYTDVFVSLFMHFTHGIFQEAFLVILGHFLLSAPLTLYTLIGLLECVFLAQWQAP